MWESSGFTDGDGNPIQTASELAFGNGYAFIGNVDGEVRAISLSNGNEEWIFNYVNTSNGDAKSDISRDITYSSGVLFFGFEKLWEFGGRDGYLLAVDPSTGNPYDYTNTTDIRGGPIVYGTNIYTGTTEDTNNPVVHSYGYNGILDIRYSPERFIVNTLKGSESGAILAN